MGLMERVSRLLNANLNHLLDQAEDPEVMIAQVVRDMDEAVVELRREAVAAVAREKQLEKRLAVAEATAEQVEGEARLALDSGDEKLARQIVACRIQTLKSRDDLAAELEGAREAVARLRDDLQQIRERVRGARDRQDELLRRKRAAEARLRTSEVTRRAASSLGAAGGAGAALGARGTLDGWADAVPEIEARAEAARELESAGDAPRRRVAPLSQDAAIEKEPARLEQAAGGDR